MHHSFAPVIWDNTEILILGSLPGSESLRKQQYYANKRNRFWYIIASILKIDVPDNYNERLEMLHILKIGLWDIVNSAERTGSLDNNITDVTVNNIPLLLKQHPNIKIIIFNGRKSEQLYYKHYAVKFDIKCIYLPSTSPANASFNFSNILSKWTETLTNLYQY